MYLHSRHVSFFLMYTQFLSFLSSECIKGCHKTFVAPSFYVIIVLLILIIVPQPQKAFLIYTCIYLCNKYLTYSWVKLYENYYYFFYKFILNYLLRDSKRFSVWWSGALDIFIIFVYNFQSYLNHSKTNSRVKFHVDSF